MGGCSVCGGGVFCVCGWVLVPVCKPHPCLCDINAAARKTSASSLCVLIRYVSLCIRGR